MKRNYRLLLLGLAPMASSVALGQGWIGECLDPMNTTPYSTPYTVAEVATNLMSVVIGTGGTGTYGGTAGPCYAPSRALANDGRFAFGVGPAQPLGPTGSVQSTFDDSMALSMGWPLDPVGDYTFARVSIGDDSPATSLLFGDQGLSLFFVGASKRYFVAGWRNTGSNVDVQVQGKTLADAVRMRWRLTNLATTSQNLGLYWACFTAMRSQVADPATGANQFNSGLPSISGNPKGTAEGYVGYNIYPDGRPLRVETKRHLSKPDYPAWVKTMAGQTAAYGLRFDNVATPSTPDATTTDLVKVGIQNFTSFNNNITINLFADPTGLLDTNDINLNEVTVLQRWPVAPVDPGAFRDIVFYMRSVWSVGSYTDPYTVILDAPRAINYAGPNPNQQGPNPFTTRIWIDNQYATIEREVPLFNVKCTIHLPAGLSLAPGESQVKTIQQINPNVIMPLDWQVVSDGTTYGDLPISVDIEPLPGPKKTLSSTIRVASKPVMTLAAGPNMLSFPYQFGDSSLDQILGLVSGLDFVGYQYDADLRGYQPVQSIQRGIGYWVIPNNAQTNLNLNGAVVHPDTPSGGLLVSLKKGWNLIGNPYNYGLPVSQLIGVAEDNPTDALTWRELVSAEYINSSLTYFTPNSALPGGGSYTLETGDDPVVQPHRAYWVFVTTSKPIRLVWPPLFQETLPGAGRSDSMKWAQTDKQWRLQLAARSESGYDNTNYVGVVADKAKAKTAQVPKAPMAPGSKLEMSIIDNFQGEQTRMAQAITDKAGRNEWKVAVKVEEPGNVTITWPNLPSLPRGIRTKLVDDLTGEKKDLRSTSSYTFRADKAGTRTFTLTAEPGGNSKPVIGNVMVRPSGRDNNSPVVVNYALSADALVTVRVLSSNGKEVYTVTRGRADSAGENSVTWALRDNANRAVAPGTYKVEILAETPNGERVRKIVPVNVIR